MATAIRGPGRPRSESAREAVLAGTVRLVEEGGYGALTMEAIARRAGVSKQTTSRWWPAKAEVVLEALDELSSAIAPAPRGDSLESELRPFLRRTVGGARGPRGRLLAGLMAEAQLDSEFSRSFRR